MSQDTSKKDSILEKDSQSHISNQEPSNSHQSPSKYHSKEPSSLRNWHQTASYGAFLKSEMSENQEEEKRNDNQSMRSPSLNDFNLVKQRKLSRPKIKIINQKITKLIPKYDQMVKDVGIIRWKKQKMIIKSQSVPGSPNSKSEYPVIDQEFAKELNKKLNVQPDNMSQQFKLGSVYSSEHGKKILKFLNENANRQLNNHSLLNYAMIIDQPDFEQERSFDQEDLDMMEGNIAPRDFYMNLNSQRNGIYQQGQIRISPAFSPSPNMNQCQVQMLMKPQKKIKPIRSLKTNEPYMKLTVIRSHDPFHIPINYILTPRGMINSRKNTANKDLILGRQQSTQDGGIPNDIVLHSMDRAISRIHCKIIYEDGFFISRSMNRQFLTFLMQRHPTVGKNSIGYNLPLCIYKYIFRFLKRSYSFYLQDLGSIFGSYIRLNLDHRTPLKMGEIYLIGSDLLFFITEIHNYGQTREKTKKRKFLPAIKERTPLVQGNLLEPIPYETMRFENDFMNYLVQQKNSNNNSDDDFQEVKIVGLSEIEEEVLADRIDLNMSNKTMSSFDDEDQTEYPERIFKKSFNRAILKIEFQKNQDTYLFTANDHDQPVSYLLGRSQECDVFININTISRKQCMYITLY